MWKDTIVEEIREVRDDHASKYNYDLKKIYKALKEEEKNSNREFIRLKPKKLEEKEEA